MTVMRWPRYKLLLYEPAAARADFFRPCPRLMIEMMSKWIPTAVMCVAVLGAETGPGVDRASLRQVQTVYLLPMGYGLDQYLANRLTAEGIFQVVTDPKRADAVFSDQIGLGFERRLQELFPPEPKPVEPEAADATEAEKQEAKTKADAESLDDIKRNSGPPISSFSRGKGNIFLVDVKTRSVLWSLYERPKKILPDELDRTSGRIVSRLKKDLSGKP